MIDQFYERARGLSPNTAEEEVVMEEARPGRIEWPFRIEFFAEEKLGFSIGHVGGLARIDFE